MNYIDSKLTAQSYYPLLLVMVFSLMGMTLPGSVTQFSMTVDSLAAKFAVSRDLILFGDTVRATMLVISMFLTGFVYRRLGLRKTMFLGIMSQVVAQFLLPNAPTVWIFIILKAIQGCNALAFPLYISTIVAWVKNEEKGLATAFFNGAFIAGSGVGAWLAGHVIASMGWQYSYYAIGIFSAAFGFLAVFISREKLPAAQPAERPSLQASNHGKGQYYKIVRMPATWLMIIGLIASNWVNQAIVVDLPVYSTELGYNLRQTGTMMMIISVITIVSSILAGFISDRFAKRAENKLTSRTVWLAPGYALAIMAALLMPFFATSSLWLLVLSASLMMFGASWAAGVFWAIPSEIYPEELNVEGTGFCSAVTTIPNPLAPLVVGIVLGGQGLWSAGWLSCALISVISLAAIISLPIVAKAR